MDVPWLLTCLIVHELIMCDIYLNEKKKNKISEYIDNFLK